MARAKSVLGTLNTTHLDLHEDMKDMSAPPVEHAHSAM